MQNIIPFPGSHRLTSASSRAAKVVSVSEVRPDARARSVDKIADHLSAGMLSRCHHLATAAKLTAMSEAKASLEAQSLITSRKDRILVIAQRLGQSVLKRKDKLALDDKKFLGHNVPMTESDAERQFKREFIERVAAARIATGMKQWQVADGLGIPQDHYKHWEKSRLMPHYLIGRFCIICRIDPDWLLTGKGQKPLRPPHLVEDEPRVAVPKPKRAKRSRAA